MRRRAFLRLAASALAAGPIATRSIVAGGRMIDKRIPGSGEAVPAIGMGSWSTFDVGSSASERAPLRDGP